MDIEDLLRAIVAQLINMMNKRVLLFISGGAVNTKDIFESLASMKMLQYDIVMTEAAKKVIPEQYIANLNHKLIDCKAELTKAVREDDFILVPVMTRNTLAKCATGIQDNLVTTGIAEALMMNKEVIAVKDSFDPQNSKNISLGFSKNPAYNKFVLGHQDNLTNFGVKFIYGENVKRTINGKFSIDNSVIENISSMDKTKIKEENDVKELNEEAKNIKDIVNRAPISEKMLSGVLTTADIIVATTDSKEICVKEGALITPLAKDYIYNNKINVKYC